MKVSDLFKDPPEVWGLRGDPYLWSALEARFANVDLPAMEGDLVAMFHTAFHALTGQHIRHERDIYVESFAFGGMSSGHVCTAYWRGTAFPLLVERHRLCAPRATPDLICVACGQVMAANCFRKGAKHCVWCVYESPERRARARYSDKLKGAPTRLNIDREAFVRWYCAQLDSCAYCGLNYRELRELRIRRRGGYCVAWDIDRMDSSRQYEEGNLALSCFVCNMAKGDMLSAGEAKIIGAAVRLVWDGKLEMVRRWRK